MLYEKLANENGKLYAWHVDSVFDIDKTVAAAGYLAKRCGGKIEIFVLLKMMYAAEREALVGWHRPITGDSFASLPKGPILSRTYNLIKNEVLSTNSDMVKWARHFSPRVGFEIKLISAPDFDSLSKLEIDALERSARGIAALIKKHGKIAEILHQQWPEWKDPQSLGKLSIPLTLKEILTEVIEDEGDVDRIVSEIQAVSSAKAALQVAYA